jgi:DNA-binding response OmpR family regulator
VSAARILIVEDEPAMMRGLRDVFTRKGFQVLAAENGALALTRAIDQAPDLILLDLMLPKVNGYEICRTLRQKGLTIPILMLTAKSQEQDIVLGLDTGADDYITKPFRISELVARVNAFLRRYRADDTIREFGPFRLDLAARKLTRGTQEVSLTAKESALLAFLATRPGRVCSRDTLLDAVWGRSAIVTGRSVDRCVATLRAKIEDDPRNPAYVHTVRDIGYRFEVAPGGGQL